MFEKNFMKFYKKKYFHVKNTGENETKVMQRDKKIFPTIIYPLICNFSRISFISFPEIGVLV